MEHIKNMNFFFLFLALFYVLKHSQHKLSSVVAYNEKSVILSPDQGWLHNLLDQVQNENVGPLFKSRGERAAKGTSVIGVMVVNGKLSEFENYKSNIGGWGQYSI